MPLLTAVSPRRKAVRLYAGKSKAPDFDLKRDTARAELNLRDVERDVARLKDPFTSTPPAENLRRSFKRAAQEESMFKFANAQDHYDYLAAALGTQEILDAYQIPAQDFYKAASVSADPTVRYLAQALDYAYGVRDHAPAELQKAASVVKTASWYDKLRTAVRGFSGAASDSSPALNNLRRQSPGDLDFGVGPSAPNMPAPTIDGVLPDDPYRIERGWARLAGEEGMGGQWSPGAQLVDAGNQGGGFVGPDGSMVRWAHPAQEIIDPRQVRRSGPV